MIPGDRRPTRWQCLEGLRKGCAWIGSGLPAAAIPCCPCVIAAASVLLNKKFSLLPKWGIGYPEKKPDPPPPKQNPHTHTHKKKSNKSLKIRQILLLGFYVVILLVFTYFIPPWYKSPIKVKICSCHCCVKLLLNSSIAEGQWSPYSAVCGVVGS